MESRIAYRLSLIVPSPPFEWELSYDKRYAISDTRRPKGGSPMYEQILYEVTEPAALITLNRPKQLNAWTDRMGAEVKHALAAAEADPRVVAIMLTGAGRGFCAG